MALHDTEPYGIVYMAENKINGKRYIGQTKWSLEKRKQQHLYHARCRKQRFRFQLALRKYPDAFEWSVIDTAQDMDELNRKEAEWISYYKTFVDKEKGYNMTPGGDATPDTSKSVCHYNEQGQFVTVYSSLQEAADAIDALDTGIAKTCRGERLTYYNQFFLYEDDFPTEALQQEEILRRKMKKEEQTIRRIVAYAKDGFFSDVFDSIQDVVSSYPKIKEKILYEVLSGKRKSTHGFIFLYEADYPTIELQKNEVIKRMALCEKVYVFEETLDYKVYDSLLQSNKGEGVNFNRRQFSPDGKYHVNQLYFLERDVLFFEQTISKEFLRRVKELFQSYSSASSSIAS